MSTKVCPACGQRLKLEAAQCPACGLEGLDQVFLSPEAYERWKKEVLEPRLEASAIRVFACCGTGLILTDSGELYGIGDNKYGKIHEDGMVHYDKPQLMARDVISAAVGYFNSIWVTRDGEVHIRGDNQWEIKEKFPGFSGAKAVYACKCTFFLVDTENRIYGFGKNDEEQIQPFRYRLTYDFARTPVNRGVIHTPVCCTDKDWMLATPHREASMPIQSSVTPDIQKMCITNDRYRTKLSLRKDGTVLWEDNGETEIWAQDAVDIAMDYDCCLISCRNGEILWCISAHRRYFSKRFRLPREGE